MALMVESSARYAIGDGDRLVTVKWAMFAIGGAIKVGELGNGAAGIWGQVVIVFRGEHGLTSLSNECYD